jgi:putative ABC transport system permease protein
MRERCSARPRGPALEEDLDRGGTSMTEIVLEDTAWDMAIFLLALLILVLAVVAIVAARRPVYFRMALRNAFRRPSQTTMALLGLMVGTAILSGSLVGSDTMLYSITQDVYLAADVLDEWVIIQGEPTFNYSVYETLASDPGVAAKTDGLAPAILLSDATAFNTVEKQMEPGIVVQGFDPALDGPFGGFTTVDGEKIDGSELGPNEAIINEAFAESILAEEGHLILVYYLPPGPANASGPGQGSPDGGETEIEVANLVVRYIVRDEGKANYFELRNMFITLSNAQTLIGVEGAINAVKVSNNGDIVEGGKNSDQAQAALEAAIADLGPEAGASPEQFQVYTIKMDAVEASKSASDSLKDFLFMASSFTVVAGVMLIISIFSMLAEERKKELGISRAIGMRRASLVRTFMFEGVVYSLIAAALGTIVGLGIGYALVWSMLSNFGAAEAVDFYYQRSSLVIAFSGGALITIGTVVAASWRVSKLNIVRAIRSIEEPVMPKGTTRGVIVGGVLIGLGALLTLGGFSGDGNGVLQVVGPNSIIFGLALVIRRWASKESAFTFGGLGVLIYSLLALFFLEGDDDGGTLDLVIIGLLLVGGAVLALVSNSGIVVRGVAGLLAMFPRGMAIAEPAIAHPLNKGFRTGMTIAMFALIVFIVMLFSIFFTVFTPNVEEEGGGYDLYATSSVPVEDIYNLSFSGITSFAPTVEYGTLTNKISVVDQLAYLGFWGNFFKDGEEIPTYGPPYHSITGIDEQYASHVTYKLTDRADGYANDQEVWMAVTQDPSLAIVDSTTASTNVPIEVGDQVTLPPLAGGPPGQTYKIVGIVDEMLFYGLFVQKEGFVADFPQVGGSNLFLMKVVEGLDVKEVANELEADMVIIGLDVLVMDELLQESVEQMEAMFQMFELFMSLGLVVGIASLGVLSVRTVIERKQEIGIIRAIGYRKSMVLWIFLTEMLFVTTMGVLIGLGIGLTAGYGIWSTGMEDTGTEFSVPWENIGIIILMTYVAAVICTILPAYKASRTNPAEAVRWLE